MSVDGVTKVFGDGVGVKLLCLFLVFLSAYEKFKNIQNSNYKEHVEKQILEIRESNLSMAESNLKLSEKITNYLSPETLIIQIKNLLVVYKDLDKDQFFIEIQNIIYKE